MREKEATKSEIAQATVKKSASEDAILVGMAEIEERTKSLPNVDKQWAEAQAEFARQQAEAKERLERLQAEQKAATAELAKAEVTLPAAVRPVYNRLVKSHGPEGMAAVRDRVCQACRSTLTQQRWIETQQGAFSTCSNCGRALYPEA